MQPEPELPCLQGIIKHSLIILLNVLEQDPKAPGPYLFSDGQNMYNGVVLVCTVNVYIPASLGRRTILRYHRVLSCQQVRYVGKVRFSMYRSHC